MTDPNGRVASSIERGFAQQRAGSRFFFRIRRSPLQHSSAWVNETIVLNLAVYTVRAGE